MARIAPLTLALLIAATCGCSSLSGLSGAFKLFPKKPVFADARNPAIEVACVWQPGEGRGGQGVPARGFSGQVFFFTKKNAEPVLVDGTVRIYLFADRGSAEDRTKPIRQFDYEPQAWSAHATMASLGPGYSVFVPYPYPEAYQVRCQLRARFTPSHGGPAIWSEAVTMVLEGPPQPGSEPAWWTNIDKKNAPPTVANYEVTNRRGTLTQLSGETPEEGEATRKLRTDTFSLGEVRPASYQEPAARKPRPSASQSRLKARPAPDVIDELGILPTGSAPAGTAASRRSHPLTGTAAAAAASPHPLATEMGAEPALESRAPAPSTEAPSTRFQSGRTTASSHPIGAVEPLPQDSTGGSAHPLAE